MIAVNYRFKVKSGKELIFEQSWRELTQLFYNHANSLGSRLHKEDDTTYFAYAQWPDNETRETGFSKLPETSNQFSTMMQESCDSIETLHAAEVVDDLLKN